MHAIRHNKDTTKLCPQSHTSSDILQLLIFLLGPIWPHFSEDHCLSQKKSSKPSKSDKHKCVYDQFSPLIVFCHLKGKKQLRLFLITHQHIYTLIRSIRTMFCGTCTDGFTTCVLDGWSTTKTEHWPQYRSFLLIANSFLVC